MNFKKSKIFKFVDNPFNETYILKWIKISAVSFKCIYIHWNKKMIQEGTTFDHDFYVVVDKQCRTENAYAGHQHNIFIQIS